MTNPNLTEIIFVVDRSGSMNSIAAAMSQGFDEFINKQKEISGECKVTAVQFDSEYEVLFTALPLSEVPPYKLQPRGSTALYDAIGHTVNRTGTRLASLPEGERPGKVLFVIITDGYENASQEFKQKNIRDMIEHQRSKYSWEFIFLGANQDAVLVGKELGISVNNSVTYDANVVGASGLMRGLGSAALRYRATSNNVEGNLFSQMDYEKAVEEVKSQLQNTTKGETK